MCPQVLRQQASGWLSRNIQRVSLKARRSQQAPGPVECNFEEFSGNVSHSDVEGLMFDRGPNAQGKFNLGGNTHLPYTDPSDTNSARLETVIKDFTSYKNSGAAIWARGENHVFDGLKIADSAIGYTHAYPGVAPYHGDYTSKVDELPVRGRKRQ